MKDRIIIEDALKHIHESEYYGQSPSADGLAGALSISREKAADVLATLLGAGFVGMENGQYKLTASGTECARHVIRAHRLFETHLAKETGLEEADWHRKAERAEHALSEQDIEALSKRLGDPRFDPHGDPIPTSEGSLPPAEGCPLQECAVSWEGKVFHIEDEPIAVYNKIVRAGLAPGTRIKIKSIWPDKIIVWADGSDVVLSQAMAAALRVKVLAEDENIDADLTTLAELASTETGLVAGLSYSCRGPERHRLLDLGVVPGTKVSVVMKNPSGSPVAYNIRGATIALRTQQARQILIKKVEAKV